MVCEARLSEQVNYRRTYAHQLNSIIGKSGAVAQTTHLAAHVAARDRGLPPPDGGTRGGNNDIVRRRREMGELGSVCHREVCAYTSVNINILIVQIYELQNGTDLHREWLSSG